MNNPFVTLENKLDNIENLLLSLKNNPLSVKESENQVLTIKEAAKLLHCSVPTLYSKHSKQELPGVSKVGKRLLFNRQILLDWINEKQQKTVEQIKAESHGYLVNKNGGLKNG